MNSDMSFINDLIRTVRQDHGLTLENVAEGTDFSVSAISRYELSRPWSEAMTRRSKSPSYARTPYPASA